MYSVFIVVVTYMSITTRCVGYGLCDGVGGGSVDVWVGDRCMCGMCWLLQAKFQNSQLRISTVMAYLNASGVDQ